jgi:hypothetical protein
LLAVFSVAVLVDALRPESAPTGEVLGATQRSRAGNGADLQAVASASPPASRRPSPEASAPNGSSPSGWDAGASFADAPPVIAVGQVAIRTWQDSFGRSRLQIIVPVRDDDTRWAAFPTARSTYRILDNAREIASGTFTALPTVIGPGATAYLVDTINVPALTRRLSATSDVSVVATEPPALSLSVTGLRLTSGIGGGMRATGRVHNDGAATSGLVVAGAIALDRHGTPLAAVYDAIDVGRVEPGEARPFATDYDPGAPPVSANTIGELLGVAFEAGT